MIVFKHKPFGSKIFKKPNYRDSRGFLIPINEFKNKLFSTNRQIVTFSKKFTLRGLHYKTKKREAKLMTILKGKIFEVVIDLNKNSKTFMQYFSCYLYGNGYNQIYLPKNVAHGYYVVSKEAIIHYTISGKYEPQYETGLRWNDKSLNIKWPSGKKNLSKKDKKNYTKNLL
tara:strand:- start:54 stop:566 length:513 start_codon:yes stop_codon:yes gene_type:complete